MSNLQSVKDVMLFCRNELASLYDEREAASIAGMLIEGIIGKSKAEIISASNASIDNEKYLKCIAMLNELMTGKPIQYVLGFSFFYGLKINVNENVLIPRPETEELVQHIINAHKDKRDFKILDVGTGSGCIALALKKNLPSADVWALDISEEALNVASQNALQAKLNINWLLSDFLNKKNLESLPKDFDIIVSNPPYIEKSRETVLHKNVTAFEPHKALFVPDENPLLFYAAIADFVKGYCNKRVNLYLEINEAFPDETQQVFSDSGFEYAEIVEDFFGRKRFCFCVSNLSE